MTGIVAVSVEVLGGGTTVGLGPVGADKVLVLREVTVTTIVVGDSVVGGRYVVGGRTIVGDMMVVSDETVGGRVSETVSEPELTRVVTPPSVETMKVQISGWQQSNDTGFSSPV